MYQFVLLSKLPGEQGSGGGGGGGGVISYAQPKYLSSGGT